MSNNSNSIRHYTQEKKLRETLDKHQIKNVIYRHKIHIMQENIHK